MLSRNQSQYYLGILSGSTTPRSSIRKILLREFLIGLVVGCREFPRNGLSRIVAVAVVHEWAVVTGVVEVNGGLEDVTAGWKNVAIVNPFTSFRVVAHLLSLLQKQRFIVFKCGHSTQSRIL